MHGSNIIEVCVARLHAVGAHRLHQRWGPTAALLDDAPIGHLSHAAGLAVDGPARAVVMRAAVRGPVIDVTADAKPELRILVQDLAGVSARRAFLELTGNKGLIRERPCHELRDLGPALRTGI